MRRGTIRRITTHSKLLIAHARLCLELTGRQQIRISDSILPIALCFRACIIKMQAIRLSANRLLNPLHHQA
jgi:hypothetical protein